MALTEYGHPRFAEAAQEVLTTLSYVETAMAFLARLHSDHDHDGHLGFEAITTLCQQGIRGVLDRHNDKVEDLIQWHCNTTRRES